MKFRICEINRENDHYDTKPDIKNKIYGFYHIYCGSNDWRGIVNEQMEFIKLSGLNNFINNLFVAIIGNDEDRQIVKSMLSDFPYKVIYENVDGGCYEFPCLKYMKELSTQDEFLCFYFHTKCSSYSWNKETRINFEWKRIHGMRWRNLMNYYVLYKWHIAVNVLKSGYDAYGILLRDNPYPHFSGNFWWATSSCVKNSREIDVDFVKDRYNAEFWVLSGFEKKIYSPFKRGLLLKIIKTNYGYKQLPWWNLKNLLYLVNGKVFK